MNTTTKIGLSVVETGWLLQKSEAQVRSMLKRAELPYAVEGRLVSIADVEARLETALAFVCFRWLRSGLIDAPRPQTRWGRPASLYAALDALQAANLARPPVELSSLSLSAFDDPAAPDRTELSLTAAEVFPSVAAEHGNSTSSLLYVP